MRFTIEKFQTDVMARLGEIARPPITLPVESVSSDVPWPEDVVSMKVTSLLGVVGAKLIREAPAGLLGGGIAVGAGDVVIQLMPCGLYGAEIHVPEGFLRLVSAKMSGWVRSVNAVVMPESAEWGRQWSGEGGIAGCAERPRAYLDRDESGLLLRLVGCESEEDAVEWVNGWIVPEVDEGGGFEFPEGLYGELVSGIVGVL